MKNIKELLQYADPLRHESEPSQDQRNAQRRAVLGAASSVRGLEGATLRLRRSTATLFAVFVVIVIVGLFLGERMWSPVIRDVQAAVRFEVRLAEDRPAPGLREAKVSGTDRSIYLHDEVVVTNGDISAARSVRAGSEYTVLVEFDASGAEKMRVATGKHIGKPIAILLDGQVMIAPVLRSPIDTSAEITGNLTQADAERIVKGIIGR
jgi:hypothetical protein